MLRSNIKPWAYIYVCIFVYRALLPPIITLKVHCTHVRCYHTFWTKEEEKRKYALTCNIPQIFCYDHLLQPKNIGVDPPIYKKEICHRTTSIMELSSIHKYIISTHQLTYIVEGQWHKSWSKGIANVSQNKLGYKRFNLLELILTSSLADRGLFMRQDIHLQSNMHPPLVPRKCCLIWQVLSLHR